MQTKIDQGASASRPGARASHQAPTGLDHSASPPRADFTLAEFLAWARTKPAGQRYNFMRADDCALAQFGRETGRAHLIGLRSGQIIELTSDSFVRALCLSMTFGELVAHLDATLPPPRASEKWAVIGAYLTEVSA